MSNLPTLAEVYEDSLELAFKHDQFNQLINHEPRKEWVRTNEYAGNSKYIPIGIIETTLQKIFKQFRIEVLREGALFNAVYVAVRVHYPDPVSSQWTYHDGVGAVQLQVKKGSSPAQLENLNNGAVMMALPMAKSYAIKDACEHIGRLFGRDLNRKDFLTYAPDQSIADKVDEKERKRVIEWINNATTIDQLKQVEQIAFDMDIKEWDIKYKQLNKQNDNT
jgi:hypothetical protein